MAGRRPQHGTIKNRLSILVGGLPKSENPPSCTPTIPGRHPCPPVRGQSLESAGLDPAVLATVRNPGVRLSLELQRAFGHTPGRVAENQTAPGRPGPLAGAAKFVDQRRATPGNPDSHRSPTRPLRAGQSLRRSGLPHPQRPSNTSISAACTTMKRAWSASPRCTAYGMPMPKSAIRS